MRSILSEKTIVAVLFVVVLISFSLAQEDSRKMEKTFLESSGVSSASYISTSSKKIAAQPVKQEIKKTILE